MVAEVSSLARCMAGLSFALLAACSASGSLGDQESTRSGPGSPSTAAGETPPASRSVLDPRLTIPAASSGALDANSVPSAEKLGAGWEAFADPGAAADGYAGNGSFVRERDGAELATSLIPLGCAEVAAVPVLPQPRHALEATYRKSDGSAAVVIVLDFADEHTARRLLIQLGELVSACPPPAATADPQSPYRLIIEVSRNDEQELRDERRETGQGARAARWVEVAIRDERRVAMATVEVNPDAPGPDLDQLARLLHEVLRHG